MRAFGRGKISFRVLPWVALNLLFTAMCPAQSVLPGENASHPVVMFNQQFIEGLYSRLDLKDQMAVFQTVFAAMGDEVVVYPTENYYYFQLYANGTTTWGNLRLDTGDRDQGVMHLGYFEYDENGRRQDREGHDKVLSAADGVLVKHIAPLVYSVEYLGKIVRFHLHDVAAERPPQTRQQPNEVFVGPVFDESGLKFFLLFNRNEKHFLYLLNEERYVPEDFISIGEDVVVGRRTGFVFFQDKKNSRKVLVAAHGRSVDRNDYYDGPFDQLPDNYVDQTQIARYIEQAYPFAKGEIDRFGGYRNNPGSRVAIFPYYVYYDDQEVVRFVKSCRNSGLTEDQFYACITPDPAQVSMTRSGPAPKSHSRVLGEATLKGNVVVEPRRKIPKANKPSH